MASSFNSHQDLHHTHVKKVPQNDTDTVRISSPILFAFLGAFIKWKAEFLTGKYHQNLINCYHHHVQKIKSIHQLAKTHINTLKNYQSFNKCDKFLSLLLSINN